MKYLSVFVIMAVFLSTSYSVFGDSGKYSMTVSTSAPTYQYDSKIIVSGVVSGGPQLQFLPVRVDLKDGSTVIATQTVVPTDGSGQYNADFIQPFFSGPIGGMKAFVSIGAPPISAESDFVIEEPVESPNS